MEVPRLGNIRVFRQRIGWTQAQLANAVNIGQSYIAKIEQGKQQPSYELLVKIFNVLRNELMSKGNKKFTAKSKATLRENMTILHPKDPFSTIQHKFGDFDQIPVLDGERCVGCITSQQLVNLLNENTHDATPIEEIMGPPLPTFAEDIPIEQIKDIMKYIEAALLSDQNGITGIITRSDILDFSRLSVD